LKISTLNSVTFHISQYMNERWSEMHYTFLHPKNAHTTLKLHICKISTKT